MWLAILATTNHDLPRLGDRYTTMASSLDMPITDLHEAVEAIHALIHAVDTS